jgi:hypothetical protein
VLAQMGLRIRQLAFTKLGLPLAMLAAAKLPIHRRHPDQNEIFVFHFPAKFFIIFGKNFFID